MAEIGLAASLIGIVSFGLQVCKGLTDYYNTYSKAEDDVKHFCDEIKCLTQTLTSFEKSMQGGRVNMDAEALVNPLIESCKSRIMELDLDLKKVSTSRKDGNRSMRRVMTRAVRLTYPFHADTIRRLRENVSKVNEIMQQAASSVLIRQNNSIQDTINQFYTKEESKDIMRWLDPPSPVYVHLDVSAKHTRKTGSWLLSNPEFMEWKDSPSSVLWIQGNAGSGKTVLCSTVIESLTKECGSQANAGIAYFYFDFNNHSIAQEHNRLLRSLIEQLSSQCGDIPKPLVSLYQRCRKGTVQPMTSDLLNTLQSIISSFSLLYLVIDAVDECKEKPEFLRFLSNVALWKLPQIHVFATSRTDLDAEIRKRKWNCFTMVVEERLVNADVETHVRAILEDDEVLSRWPPGEQRLIEISLITRANGNFRWVACQIGVLRECHTPAELEDAINSLPATLEETYERALLGIEDQRKEGMRNVLRWLCFSARPIRLDEIAEVMAINFDAEPRPAYDPRKRLIDPQRFFQTYSGLVRVLKIKTKSELYRELRLAHLSVRDFLISTKIRGSPVSFFATDSLSANTSIAETCLIYLRQFDQPLRLFSMPPESYYLARYAAKNWPYHVQAVFGATQRLLPKPADQLSRLTNTDQNAPLIALIIEFLLQMIKVLSLSSTSAQVKSLPTELNYLCTELLSAQDARLQCQIRLYDPDTPWIEQPDIARTLSALPSALYYAAHTGLAESVKLLLANGLNVNATGGRYGSALQAAACKGYTEVVKVLLANGADVNQTGGDYGTALQGACSYGKKSCVELLLENGARVNERGGEHTTALHAAAFNGYDNLAALLLQKGAEIDPLDGEHRSPLIWAAGEGHADTVKLLLDHGADCMVRDDGGWTALDECAPPGYDSIVRMLIDHHRPIIHSKDDMNYTALHHTAGQRHDSTVQILLDSGVDIDAQTCYGHTALFQAVGSGHEETVRMFLEHGANVHVTNKGGWSVLHLAAFHGHISTGALLLDHGADVNCAREGMTALHISILKRDVGFVDLLLEHNADVTIIDECGCTALEFLSEHAPDILQNLSIEIPTATITGLRIAASQGRDVRIRQLLERGADINAKDEYRMTALLWAGEKGAKSTIKLLVENGADVNVKSDFGTTLMSYVRGNAELEEFLLANGYNLDATESADDGPSEQASGAAALQEIRELLEERMEELSSGDGLNEREELDESMGGEKSN